RHGPTGAPGVDRQNDPGLDSGQPRRKAGRSANAGPLSCLDFFSIEDLFGELVSQAQAATLRWQANPWPRRSGEGEAREGPLSDRFQCSTALYPCQGRQRRLRAAARRLFPKTVFTALVRESTNQANR